MGAPRPAPVDGLATIMKTQVIALFAWSLSLTVSDASLLDALGLGKKNAGSAATFQPLGVSALSQDQVVQGLKEALSKGVQQAVTRLGHDDGFLTNLNVKIPMPEQLRTVEKTLRLLKQDKLADDFVVTMNHAAERAVPEAAGVFGDAIKGMSIADAKAILTGTNTAATEYFRKTTSTNLFARFLPIVKQATEQTGATSTYKRLMAKAGNANAFGSLGRSLIQAQTVDVDSYVTNKAMDGLFKMVAEEEKRIRENPIARTSDLLQRVFGAEQK